MLQVPPQKVFGPSKTTPNAFSEGTWSSRYDIFCISLRDRSEILTPTCTSRAHCRPESFLPERWEVFRRVAGGINSRLVLSGDDWITQTEPMKYSKEHRHRMIGGYHPRDGRKFCCLGPGARKTERRAHQSKGGPALVHPEEIGVNLGSLPRISFASVHFTAFQWCVFDVFAAQAPRSMLRRQV